MENALRQPDNGVTKAQRMTQLPVNTVQQAEYAYTTHAAFVPKEFKPEQLTEPGFWAVHATRFKALDEVRAIAEDGTWMARLLVLETGRTWVRMKQLEFHLLGTQDEALTRVAQRETDELRKNFDVKHRGPRGWSVVRKGDSQVMHEGAQTRDAAEGWLTDYLKTTASGAAPVTA